MKYLVKNKYWHIYTLYNIDKLLYLLIDRPDDLLEKELYIWYKETIYTKTEHRDYDLSSFVDITGEEEEDAYMEWQKNGKYKRENEQPVRIFGNGDME